MTQLPRAMLIDMDDTILSAYGRPDVAWNKVAAEFADEFGSIPSTQVATAVVDYALNLGSALTSARVGFFLEQHREALFVEDAHLAALRAQAPRQPRYLDRRREPGRLVKPWNLVVPERVLSRTWAEVA